MESCQYVMRGSAAPHSTRFQMQRGVQEGMRQGGAELLIQRLACLYGYGGLLFHRIRIGVSPVLEAAVQADHVGEALLTEKVAG